MNSVELVKKICKDRKIPIARLEKDLGFSNGYIGQLRKGSFPTERGVAIAQCLGIPVEYLLTGEKKDAPSDNEEAFLEMLRGSTATRALLHTVSRMTDDEIMAYVDFIARTRGEK